MVSPTMHGARPDIHHVAQPGDARERLALETHRGWPVAIEWSGRREIVLDIIDFWVVEGEWWHDPRRRVYFRIRTLHRMLDIYVMGGHWTVSRVWD